MDNYCMPIFYFSGTGNTWWAAQRLAEELAKHEIQTSTHSIEQVSRDNVNQLTDQAKIVALGYPIYGSDAPLIMQDFISALPQSAQIKPMLVFVTQAAWSGDGAYFMHQQIEAKGYQIRWAVHFNMPMNVNLDCGAVLNCFFRSMNAKPAGALKRVEKLARRVGKGKSWIMGRSSLLSCGWMQRLPFRKTMNFWQTRMLSVDPELCNGCGRCEKICPVGNIHMKEGLPQFGDQCNLCLRCFNYCPQLAVLAFDRPFNKKWYGEAPYQGPVAEFRPELLVSQDGF